MGNSSGGNYALMLGLKQKLILNFKKICIIALYPVTDLLALKKVAVSLKENDANKAYMIKNTERYFKKNFSDIKDSEFKKASPFYQLKKNLPSTLLQHGTADDISPISQSQDFYNKALQLGIDIELDVMDSANHGDKVFVDESNLKRIFAYLNLKLEL